MLTAFQEASISADTLPFDGALLVADLDPVDWTRADDRDRALASLAAAAEASPAPVLVGVATTPLPQEAAPFLDRLTVALGGGLAPYCAGTADDLDAVLATVAAAPRASLTLAAVLEAASRAALDDGLLIESLAYSTLLAGPEFAAWRTRTVRRTPPAVDDPVLVERHGAALLITLNRPERRNAFGHAMRDGFLDALDVARLDPTVSEVVVRGAGPAFCSGGDLDEFGTAPDPVTAHLVRLRRSAGRAVAALGGRVRFEVHGACVGAGVEVPSFASRVTAAADARFRLPELGMGLIPGAGGTVSLTGRIGRWRTAYLALTDRAVDAATALEWGLIDART